MTKRGIYNESTFRGRFKGNTDGRVSNPEIRERWDNVEWGKDYFWCEECKKFVDGKKELGCPLCKERRKNERIQD